MIDKKRVELRRKLRDEHVKEIKSRIRQSMLDCHVQKAKEMEANNIVAAYL